MRNGRAVSEAPDLPIVRDTVDKHRGFIVKSQADSFMLAFPSAACALRASLEMRDRIAEGFAAAFR